MKMLLKKFFQIIDNSFVGRYIDKRLNLIEVTNPDRIYVENIRSFYNLTTPIARTFCDMAVKENLFKKRFGVECPKCGKLISHYQTENQIPDKIICDNCLLLEEGNYEFKKSEIVEIIFYQLNKQIK